MDFSTQKSHWKLNLPKTPTSWVTLTLLVLFSILIMWTLFVVWYADNIYINCPVVGCVVEASVPKYASQEWLTMCYNQYSNYQDRINLC